MKDRTMLVTANIQGIQWIGTRITIFMHGAEVRFNCDNERKAEESFNAIADIVESFVREKNLKNSFITVEGTDRIGRPE